MLSGACPDAVGMADSVTGTDGGGSDDAAIDAAGALRGGVADGVIELPHEAAKTVAIRNASIPDSP